MLVKLWLVQGLKYGDKETLGGCFGMVPGRLGVGEGIVTNFYQVFMEFFAEW
jgi:hypothetical protein